MKDLTNEQNKLKDTIDIVKELLKKEKLELADLEEKFDGDMEEYWMLYDRMNIHINNLKKSKDNPYFARVDFKRDDDLNNESIYIGKNGVIKDNNIIVTDWRAPISSLYYDSEVGKCSYKSPEGIINGEMNLKRQYEIELGNLISYHDVDLVSNDALLQKYLNDNNDSRLKSIVATIQKEQNDVIRKEINDNLIIQGVAGSGKTTVALHRIAYLVYNYIETIKQNQYLVIGPNPVFLKYIKSVLPDLDVSGVKQCTFEDFCNNYINENITINNSDKKVIDSISGNNVYDIDKFKCSYKYKKMIDKFIKNYLNDITSKSIFLGNFEVLSSNVINDIFNETDTKTYTNLNNRIEITIERLCRHIENNKNNINNSFNKYITKIYDDIEDLKEKEEYKNKIQKDIDELKRNCRTLIRNYFNKVKLEPTELYKKFISSINNFDIYNYDNLNRLKKETLNNIKNKTYDFEDLSALIYLKSLINPDIEYKQIKHVVVDEAQDLGEFNFYVLKKSLPFATFSIFGDIAQSIYDYRGIDNWNEVNNVMFKEKGNIIHFNKSYRTTSQIMKVADDVSEKLGLGRSDLVVREGKEVTFNKVNLNDIPNYILNKINEYKEKGYKTIAVISKTDKLSESINNELNKIGLNIPNISMDDDLSDEKFRICTISNQLAKGLEFDAVIINNASEYIYNSNNNLDLKLLYVAITRALHELDIVYDIELTNVLNK